MNPIRALSPRSLWLIPIALSITSTAALATEMLTKITAINGEFSYNHQSQILVTPGDTISLSADEVWSDESGQGSCNMNVEDFLWSSDANSSDGCDPQYDCTNTNFETTSYGVNFYVPYNMGQTLTLTVIQRDQYDRLDQVTLVNKNYSVEEPAVTPTTAYSDPTEYPTEEFDYNRGLAGQGRWVYIEGTRTFVPYSYQEDWQPYQHGYWYWSTYGWTWQSYDPWGWVTDHYGNWRHHGTYGWVWTPFESMRWQPAVVSWFHSEQGVGWYPYWEHANYRHGSAQGYDDGYWDGYRAGLRDSGRGYRWGWTFVGHHDFLSNNAYNYRKHDIAIYDQYNYAYTHQYYGGELGYGRTNAREFVAVRVGRPIPVVQVSVNQFRGGVAWVRPTQVVVPVYYRQVQTQAVSRVQTGARVPVGSVVSPSGAVRRPAVPVVSAPRVPNSNGTFTPMPNRSRIPPTQTRPAQQTPPSVPVRVVPTPGRVVTPTQPGRVVNPVPPVEHPGRVVTPNPSVPATQPGRVITPTPTVPTPQPPRVITPPPVQQPPRVVTPNPSVPATQPPRVVTPPPVQQPPRVVTPPPVVQQPPRVVTPPVQQPPRVVTPPPVQQPPRVVTPPVQQPPRVVTPPPVQQPPRVVTPPVQQPPRVVTPTPPPVQQPPRVVTPSPTVPPAQQPGRVVTPVPPKRR